MTEKSDLEIIESVVKGKVNDYALLVKRYRDKVFRYVCGYCGNEEDAMEISQDILVAAYSSLSKFRGEAKFSTWLFSIMINHCRNHIRKKGRIKKVSISDLYDDSGSDYEIPDCRGSLEEDLVTTETYKAAIAELSNLPDDYREAVILCDVEEMSYEDISEALSISMSNVKIRIHRGREMLRKRLNERGYV